MKKSTFLLTFMAIAFLPLYVGAQCGQLVWSDEFNGSSLNTSDWGYDLGNGCPNQCGWGNSEPQFYTDNASNIRMENGKLVIEARNDNGNYTSAKITTRGKKSWRYGRFEMSAKISAGTGLWPAFWMLQEGGAWPQTGEIDIMENRGDQPNRVAGTLHYGDSYPNNRHDGTGFELADATFTDDFHEFAIEWEAGEIRWYVDDVLFKTESREPNNTLNPPSNNDPWPWDAGDYYLIINLAVGSVNTPYTGYQNPDFGPSGTMEIDYVRVYDAAQPNVSVTGPDRVFEGGSGNYSIPTNAGETYVWSVPSDATLVSGQGTGAIEVDWTNSSGGEVRVEITHGTGAQCPGNTYFYTKQTEVFKNTCEFVMHDFQGGNSLSQGFMAGQLFEDNNPSSNTVNSSSRVGRYERNGGEQWDALYFDKALLDDGSEFVSGNMELKMDVYTSAAVGTQIDLQMANADANTVYPNGIHGVYTTTTTATNAWHTVTFSHSNTLNAQFADDLDRLIFLFDPGNYTNTTFYFDNVRRELATPPADLTITGNSVLDINETGVAYSVSGGVANSSFEWSVPVGASVASGQGTDAIIVDYGLSGGTMSVVERVNEGCVGDPGVLQISVGGNSCALFSDEYDDTQVESQWLASDLGGFTYQEVGSDWTITSTGHDEWAYLELDINDGQNTATLDFTNAANLPLLKVRAKASDTLMMRVTFVDINGVQAQNQYLSPLNGLVLTSEYQEFEIDFDGHFWDEWTAQTTLDESQIDKIRITFNPAWVSFPADNPFGGTFNTSFEGDIDIDYIRIGLECASAVANFTANKTSLCSVGDEVVFSDNSIGVDGNDVLEWDFGSGADPATATGAGPHTVSYITSGFKTVSLDINSGAATKTRTDYVYVSPQTGGCVFTDGFDDGTVDPLITTDGNFDFAESMSNWMISSTGYEEYDQISMSITDNGVVLPINFSCPNTSAMLKVVAQTSEFGLLRVGLKDAAGNVTSNQPLFADNTFELSNGYLEMDIDFTGRFYDEFAIGGQVDVDSTQITEIVFLVNPGFGSFPHTGVNRVYDEFFAGDLDIDWVGLGDGCNAVIGTSESVSTQLANVYPNPVKTTLNASEYNGYDYELIDARGQLRRSGVIDDAIDFEDLPNGIYHLRLSNQEGLQIARISKQ